VDATRTIPLDEQLEFVYYALVRERFGQKEILYEYRMEEGAQGAISITVPVPPDPIREWKVEVFGYRNEVRVFQRSIDARDFF
jgi:hypothetical protein